MRIIGPPSADYATVVKNVLAEPNKHDRFLAEMVPALWTAGLHYGIDPVGVVAQAYKETGGGTYPGKVKPEFFNPCGLKVRYQNLFPETAGDNPLAHQMFPNWMVGAAAHVQHLCAYAGLAVLETIVDPRYTYVVGKYSLENWEELSGKWAPAADYGQSLVTIARRFQRV